MKKSLKKINLSNIKHNVDLIVFVTFVLIVVRFFVINNYVLSEAIQASTQYVWFWVFTVVYFVISIVIDRKCEKK